MNLNFLSNYESLYIIKENEYNKIEVVKQTFTNKIYIKKTLTNYNLNVYRMLKNINSIHIPQILALIETHSKLVIIEEFVNGNTLEEMLDQDLYLDEKTIIQYIITICDTLFQLHSLDTPIIHRDIKLSNIIISNDNILKIIDFDAARIYNKYRKEDTCLLGTEGYAAPEAYGFGQTTCKSDIYSIGVLINVLLTGYLPKEKLTCGDLGNIVNKCTSLSPNDRYSSLLDLKKDLFKFSKKSFKKEPMNYDKKSFDALLSCFALPGFRGDIWGFKLMGLVWYVFLVLGLFSSFLFPNPKTSFLQDLSMVAFFLFSTLFLGNYLNMWSKIPIINTSSSTLRKGISVFIYYTIFLLIYSLLS